MSAASGRFRPADRLRNSRDFQRINRWGWRRASPNFVVLVASRGGEPGRVRLGLTVSRRVGNAVVRNRVKRRIRAWFRRHRSMLAEGVDVVVIARGPSARLSSAQIEADLCGLLAPEEAA